MHIYLTRVYIFTGLNPIYVQCLDCGFDQRFDVLVVGGAQFGSESTNRLRLKKIQEGGVRVKGLTRFQPSGSADRFNRG